MLVAETARQEDDIFVYMGGNQPVPARVRRARIHISVKIIPRRAFYDRHSLISVEFHDGIEIIEEQAFSGCWSLKSVKLLGVRIIKQSAFWNCNSMTDVEFGDKLEAIEVHAFSTCVSLRKIRMPSVRTIGRWSFNNCRELIDVEFGEGLQTLKDAFGSCTKLKRIALPLKGDMIRNNALNQCPKLEAVDLVGGIHQTVASLHMKSWRSEMMDEINRINQTLPTTTTGKKTGVIQQWMETVIHRLDHYKAEHHKALLKEATTLLELALWKANLDDNGGGKIEREGHRTRGSRKRARKEISVTSGADVVIKNVLPFLA